MNIELYFQFVLHFHCAAHDADRLDSGGNRAKGDWRANDVVVRKRREEPRLVSEDRQGGAFRVDRTIFGADRGRRRDRRKRHRD